MKRAGVLLAALAVSVAAVVPPDAPAAGAQPLAAAAPEIGSLEQALPPGTRNVLSVFRIFKSLNARNRVYREAHGVQREMRTYYDAQIAKTRELLDDRQQLHPSQMRAYVRTQQRLIEERNLVMAITEDEKRGAKYGFESRLQRELTSVLIRVPRVRDVMTQMRDRLGDLEAAFQDIRQAIANGNPVSSLISRVEERVALVEQFAGVAQIVHGQSGDALTSVTNRVRGLLAQVEAPLDQAQASVDNAIAEISGFAAEIDQQLAAGRTVRADTVIRDVAEREVLGTIFAPGGDPAPDAGVMADAIVRGHDRRTAELLGSTAQVLDVAEFNSMRDRVQAALLGNTLERIGDICGRIIGQQRQIALTAAATGQPAPLTSTPCRLFRNPEALQAYIDAQRATVTTTTTGPPATMAGTTPPTTESAEAVTERRLLELLEVAAGTYDVAPDVEQVLWTLDDVAGVSAEGVVTISSDGSVAGGLWFTFAQGIGFVDKMDELTTFVIVYEFVDGTVTVDGSRLKLEVTATQVNNQDGEEYYRRTFPVVGVVDTDGGSLVLNGVWLTEGFDTVTYIRS